MLKGLMHRGLVHSKRVSTRLRTTLRPASVRAVGFLLLITASQIVGLPFLTPRAYAAPVQLILTSGTTWTVPPAWDNANNTIEAIGAGGNGASGTDNLNAGGGGGGGEYRKATNVSLTPNATLDINIPTGGAGNSTGGAWLKNSGGTIQIEAKNGGNASGATAGAGGTGGVGSAASYSGGAGGSGGSGNNNNSAGGGGGSAGPSGIGKNGGDGVGATSMGGGGGGGSNGGASSAGVTPTSFPGGNGGNGSGGSGSGSGGSAKNTNDAANGTLGGGGGGGSQSTGGTLSIGGNGSVQSIWDTGVGPSGGGGGGGGCGGTGCTVSHQGGDGGTYGGGAGGCGQSGNHSSANCPSIPLGGQGVIVITYTPSVSPSITQADYRWFENPLGLESTPWQGCRTESGTTSIPSGQANANVTLGKPLSDISQAYLISNASGDSSVTDGQHHMVTGQISSTTTLTFTRGAATSSDSYISYSLIECFQNEFSVQRGLSTIGSGSSSTTASISPVDVSKSMVLVTNYDDDTSTNEQTGLATGELQNSTTVLLKRFDGPAVNDAIAWQVVTFSDGSGATVQSGETTLGTGTASQTASLSSIDPAHSWLYCSYDADSNGLQQTAVGCELTNSTTASFYRNSSNAYTNRIRWYVVTFPSAGVIVQRGAQTDGGGGTDNARYDIEIPLTTPVSKLTKAYPFVTNTTSGTGTAFPRNQWINLLTSTSNLESSYWRGSSNGSGTHYWQVIEFASVSPDVGTAQSPENSPATLRSTSREFRLRMLLRVSDATVAQDTGFKLQYAQLSGSCASSTYTDADGVFSDISPLDDGSALVTNPNDPVDVGTAVQAQTYVESNTFSNSLSTLAPGEDGLWDFSLVDAGAPANSTYCFRVVRANGTPLDSYLFYPQITTSDGVFQTDIVDAGGASISAPVVSMAPAVKDFSCTVSTGTLGSTGQRLRLINHSANIPWTLSIAATDGATALWDNGAAVFDYNDPSGSPSGCSAGTDLDAYAGQLGFGFSSASVTPQSGCTSTGLALGSDAGFEEGVIDSITLATASSAAETGCYWDVQDIAVQQSIPSGQPSGTYSLNLTISVVAN